MMRTKKPLLMAGLLVLLLVACQKHPEPKTATGQDPTPGNPPVTSSAPPGGSVALPPDKTPQSPASIPPAAEQKGSSGDANTPTQANPSTLQKSQEQSGLPHSGQVNNHSVPETVGTVSK